MQLVLIELRRQTLVVELSSSSPRNDSLEVTCRCTRICIGRLDYIDQVRRLPSRTASESVRHSLLHRLSRHQRRKAKATRKQCVVTTNPWGEKVISSLDILSGRCSQFSKEASTDILIPSIYPRDWVFLFGKGERNMSDPIAATAAQTPQKEAKEAAKKRSPSDFLKSVLGRPVRVKLNSGIEYRGVLACLDGYLNIAMEQTEEFGLDGQLKAKYGDCFIRGNNVLYISAQKRKGSATNN
eukprot:scaffold11032_cov122-Cylindrotheca_fusiformis.AAC.6